MSELDNKNCFVFLAQLARNWNWRASWLISQIPNKSQRLLGELRHKFSICDHFSCSGLHTGIWVIYKEQAKTSTSYQTRYCSSFCEVSEIDYVSANICQNWSWLFTDFKQMDDCRTASLGARNQW